MTLRIDERETTAGTSDTLLSPHKPKSAALAGRPVPADLHRLTGHAG
jgi:hypothetical protein